MGSVLKLFVSSTVSTVSTVSTPDMNILLAVCCLLITGVLTDLLNTGEAREEFGLQDFANIHIRNVRESRKLKKTDKKTNKKTKGKRRKNRKAKKDQKKREQTGNQKKQKLDGKLKLLNRARVKQVQRWTLLVFRMPLIYLDMKGIKFSIFKNKKPEFKVTIELPITRRRSGTVFRLQPQHYWRPLVEI